MFKLYSAKWCPNCPGVKVFLENNNVPYEYCDVDDPTHLEDLKGLGLRGVPAIVNQKGDFISGSDINRIRDFVGV